MPAARQASRSSAKRIGGERDDRRARQAAFGLGGADAARRLDAVDSGMCTSISTRSKGAPRACAAAKASSAAAPLAAIVGRWPSRVSSARASSALMSLSSATRIESAVGPSASTVSPPEAGPW